MSEELLEKMLAHPRFLDVAMKKVGSRIEYEHVSELISLTVLNHHDFIGNDDEGSRTLWFKCSTRARRSFID
jgi:hypothetical protein